MRTTLCCGVLGMAWLACHSVDKIETGEGTPLPVVIRIGADTAADSAVFEGVLERGLSESEVHKRLKVTHVGPEFNIGLGDTAYHAKCELFPGKIIQLSFVLGQESWELHTWRTLSHEESAVMKKNHRDIRYRLAHGGFHAVDERWVQRRVDSFRELIDAVDDEK